MPNVGPRVWCEGFALFHADKAHFIWLLNFGSGLPMGVLMLAQYKYYSVVLTALQHIIFLSSNTY